MKKKLSLLCVFISGFIFSQNIPFDKLYGHSDPVNYYLGNYPVSGSAGLDINWYGGIRLQTSAGLGLQLLDNGNVGVGTDNPLVKLHVSKDNVNNQNLMLAKFTTSGNTGGSNRITIGYHNNANLEMNSGYSTTGVRYGSYGDFNIENDNLGNTVNGAINFISANKIHMAIKPNGNVGVGTDNPLVRLDVSKDNVNNQNLMLAKFATSGNTGGSNMITIGYHSKANLEMNSGYSTTGVRYGSYGDFNIENDNLGDTVNGAINFISANKIHMSIRPNGNAYLQGKFEAKEIKVTQTPTADFVFAEDYKLPKLEDVEKHIKEKKHLPEIVSAKVMEKEGVNVGEFQIKLLQKIEELTLYSIDQNKEIKSQAEKLKELTLHSIDQNEQIKYQTEKLKDLEKQLQEIVSSKK